MRPRGASSADRGTPLLRRVRPFSSPGAAVSPAVASLRDLNNRIGLAIRRGYAFLQKYRFVVN
jgi:hypothetical protein